MSTQIRLGLLMSVYLTKESLVSDDYYGGRSSITIDKFEQLLGTLHSIADFPFSESYIFVNASNDYADRLGVLRKFVNKHLPDAKLTLNRLETFRDWKRASEAFTSSDVILLKTNHDHMFIRGNVEEFYEYIEVMRQNSKNFIGSITHWPEHMFQHNSGRWIQSKIDKLPVVFKSSCTTTNGTCLVSTDFFKSWWQEDFLNGHRFVRPDNPFGPRLFFKSVDYYVPPIEYFRHMDGYGHKGIKSKIAAPIRSCCSYDKDEEFSHKALIKGTFSKGTFEFEIPYFPNFNQVWKFWHVADLICLGSAYRPSLRNLFSLFSASTQTLPMARKLIVFFSTLPLVLTNQAFLRQLGFRFLPNEDGIRSLYRIRLKLSHLKKNLKIKI